MFSVADTAGNRQWRAAAATSTTPLAPNRLCLRRGLSTAGAFPTIDEAQQPLAETHMRMIDNSGAHSTATGVPAAKPHASTAVRRRLKFLKDPYSIGQAVEETLNKNNYEEALSLTRLASKDHQVVVSWNHLIGHLMRNDKLSAAVKLYNEMKKRGQLPNAQTYTTIFRGCAKSPHAKLAVYQATRLYYSMLDSERIKPNTIHMNAVLHVCARAKDLESLFSVAKTANDRTRMPDNLTYTTVLNGLRFSTAQPHHRSASGEGEEVSVDKERASVSVGRARAVWEEVVTRWRQGLIVVDEELVCAMGRVLLMGSNHDKDDILALVEQTMGIARLDRTPLLQQTSKPEAKPAAEADAASAPPKEPTTPRVTQFVPLPASVTVSRVDDSQAGDQGSNGAVAERRGSSRITYAQPGRNVLSLIVTSLGTTRKTSLAAPYWDILTSPPYSVEPDSENWFRMLKTLRRGHASGKTALLMLSMPPEMMNERTFQLAMTSCAADNLNENVVDSAAKIFDLMKRTLPVPDPYTMRLYLQTAIASNRHFRNQTEPAARQKAKLAFGQQVVQALDRLWEPLRRVSSALESPLPGRLGDGAEQHAEPATGQAYNAQREVTALVRQMVSAADMVVSEKIADEATVKRLQTSRNLLNRQITRFYENREQWEPNLKKNKPAGGDRNASRRPRGDRRT